MNRLFKKVYGIDTGMHTGAENMACDRNLMQAFLDGSFRSILGDDACLWRFYGWHPFAVSLGYNQSMADIDSVRCYDAGVDIVRRPTGGRAVFHADEFTYSFFAETTRANEVIYRYVHEVIMHALDMLDVKADFCRSTPEPLKQGGVAAVSCFAASAKYELQVNGRKLVGSAQRRTRNVLLQHGSMPFSIRHRELSNFLSSCESGFALDVCDALQKKAVSLGEILETVPEYGVMVQCMRQASATSGGASMTMLDPLQFERFFRNQEPFIH
ncbi:lipoate--protein ligase family protein [Chlorobium phaeobacteroides]|uniref:Biotin/lipoate A/B protein ligase n=1 Tax=Chlorobium phaeobacteroides (strain DSM 266 / SMG 266 / 2430) TaxID=290317 RepID=A1BH03_CHLPD|nr:ligase [Chlorobium phaeobacteroides]ABL65680.1 biotin/lipoate A/B protein ligase [Chlorobium phaeobacteroides DSM 266]